MSTAVAELTHDAVDFDALRQVRKYARGNQQRSLWSVLLDGYELLFALVVAGLFGYGLLTALNEVLPNLLSAQPVTDPAFALLPLALLLPTLGLVLSGAVLGAAARLGPSGVDLPHQVWWLSLPVARAAGLTRMMLPRLGFAGVLGLVVGALLLAPVTFGPGLAFGAITAALWVMVLFELAALAQIDGRIGMIRKAGTTTMVLAGVVVAVGIALALLAPAADDVLATVLMLLPTGWWVLAGAGAWWPAVIMGLAVVALGVLIRRRFELIETLELARGGAAAALLGVWVQTGGADDLVRRQPGQVVDRTAGRWLLRWVRSARSAIVIADLMSLARQHGWVAWLALPAVCWIPAFTVGTNTLIPMLAVVFIVAISGMQRAAGVVRGCAAIPELDRALPLSAGQVRRLHAVGPAMLMTGFMTLACAGLVLLGAADAGLVLIGALAGVGLGACAVRAAYRPGVDFSVPPIPTAFGCVPSAAIRTASEGDDYAVVVLVPSLVCIAVGASFPLLIIAQAAVSLVIFVLATTPRMFST